MTMAALSVKKVHHTTSGSILLFQTHLKLRKVVPRMQFAIFVTKYSVDAVLPEQLHTFWGVLYWDKLMLEYGHV